MTRGDNELQYKNQLNKFKRFSLSFGIVKFDLFCI